MNFSESELTLFFGQAGTGKTVNARTNAKIAAERGYGPVYFLDRLLLDENSPGELPVEAYHEPYQVNRHTYKEIACCWDHKELKKFLSFVTSGIIILDNMNLLHPSDRMKIFDLIQQKRSKDLRFVCIFQSIADLNQAPMIWASLIYLFHDRNSFFDRYANTIIDRKDSEMISPQELFLYEAIPIAEIIKNNRSDEKYFHVIIDNTEKKITGNFSRKEYLHAALEFMLQEMGYMDYYQVSQNPPF